jgi:7,8-dihydropterin-6-yl-methyl-4-(beta-D-ribofuranosyl)aminobenzene 5'-phosphate synthase
MDMVIKECDKVEILTLQDNYIEITAMDNTEVVQRANPVDKDMKLTVSLLAEHGFSTLVKVYDGDYSASLLFDFGYSEDGAARNAVILNADMASVKSAALSHGHMDHTGGIAALSKMIPGDKKAIDFVVHPMAFTKPRYIKLGEELKIYFPEFTREDITKQGYNLVETTAPYPLVDGYGLFLGEINRVTDFEKGFPVAFRQKDGHEEWDPIEDDTAVVMNVKGKGLIVLTGCAHSGVVNTVRHAIKTTGIDRIYAIMGGYHLSGPFFEPIIARTTEELKKFKPSYIVPCHCTGRKAIMHIEKEMPEQFILNMVGTRLTFSA